MDDFKKIRPHHNAIGKLAELHSINFRWEYAVSDFW